MPGRTVKTDWKSEKPNPDEDHLKKEFDAETKARKDAHAAAPGHSRKLHENRKALIKASGLNDGQLNALAKQADQDARKAAKAAEAGLAKAAVDYAALEKKDLELVKKNAEGMQSPGNPHWQGYIWTAGYGGWWTSWDGEAEEVPYVTINTPAERIDCRAQAYGEGWFDGDHSEAHAYLAFTFRPPSWGTLRVSAWPWLHGYYQLYSNDDWYNSEYSRAEVDTWMQVHQNFWRSRQYARRFTYAGQELHPTRSGRIDGQYPQSYTTSVGQNDTVTIRVGVRLYDYARAGGSLSRLNFEAGSANYVYIPYVYWYLYH